MANEVAKMPKFEELALSKIKEYQEAGMTLYPGFNPTNSLKKARFMLNDMKVNGRPVTEVCTPTSIVQCLIESVAKGWDLSEKHAWLIPRGNQLTLMESVYGRIVRAKRASKYYKPIVQFVHEDDDFLYGVDVATGETKIFKHTTSLENHDKPIIAAYTYVTDNDGHTEIFVMSKREWLKSWTKSSNGATVAKDFERDMIYRTIISKATKYLVNSQTTGFVTQSSVVDEDNLAGDNMPEVDEQYNDSPEYVEVEEVVVEPVKVETPKVVESTPVVEEPIALANQPKEDLNSDFDF